MPMVELLFTLPWKVSQILIDFDQLGIFHNGDPIVIVSWRLLMMFTDQIHGLWVRLIGKLALHTRLKKFMSFSPKNTDI